MAGGIIWFIMKGDVWMGV